VSVTLALESIARAHGPWPRRWALGAALAAVPLVLFGGSVTTLGAGMAVEGWWIAEGHFLLFFPVDKWFRDTGTFVEHTHRLFGALVGLFALACLAATLLAEAGPTARRSALVALGAVILQGTLGGLRVLENDTGLAFLHGALAQLVFCVLCANVVLVSPEWHTDGPRGAPAERVALARAANLAWLATAGQVVLGAWYRHGLRPEPVSSTGVRFALHAFGAVLVMASFAAVLRRATALRASGASFPPSFALALRALPILLVGQIVLGGLAWAGFKPGAIGPAEWGLSVAHVLGGALFFAALALVALGGRRLARTEGTR
jgi:cytochrome c oxidase assembly protein subunit 15